MLEKDVIRHQKFLENLILYSTDNSKDRSNNNIKFECMPLNNIVKDWFQCNFFILENGVCLEADIVKYINKYKLLFFKPNRCICGHKIIDHCVIENKLSKSRIIIGNCCMGSICKATYTANKELFIHLKRLRICKTLIIPKKGLLECNPDIIDNLEKEFLNKNYGKTLKKYNIVKLSLDKLEKLLTIICKIVSYYFNLTMANDDIPHLVIEQTHSIVINQKNKTLINDYFSKYKYKNPSNDTDIYEIDYDSKDYPYWKLIIKKMCCLFCNVQREYPPKQVFSCEDLDLDHNVLYLYDDIIPFHKNMFLYFKGTYTDPFFYNIENAVCSDCFKIKYCITDPSNNIDIYEIGYGFNDCPFWKLTKKNLQCTICANHQIYPLKQIFCHEHITCNPLRIPEDGVIPFYTDMFLYFKGKYNEPFFYNIDKAVCSDCFKITIIPNNPPNEVDIYEIKYNNTGHPFWELKK